MIRRTILATLLTFSIAFPAQTYACTIFKITLNGRTFAGNNEAWNDPNTKVWFLAPEKGKYGRVFFGYRNGFSQGGMNNRGLFYDWVAGYKSDWKRDDKKFDYPGNFSEKVLEEAATVEEAIALYEKYYEKCNDASFAQARTLLADKSGASAVIGWENGRLKVTRGVGACQVLGWDQEATERRLKELEDGPANTAAPRSDPSAENNSAKTADAIVEAVSCVLSACQQSGTYTTFYSNVYDLQKGEVHVYQFHGKVPMVTLNLEKELAKGNHYYDLPKINEQMKLPPAVDGRTFTRTAIDPAAYATLAGAYEITPGLRMNVTNRDEKLFVQFPGEPAYELWPLSKTKYFLNFVDVQLTFALDAAGQAKAVAFHSWEKDLTGVRIPPETPPPASGPSNGSP